MIDRGTSNILRVTTPVGNDAEWEWILTTILENWLGLRWDRVADTNSKTVAIRLSESDKGDQIQISAAYWQKVAKSDDLFIRPAEPLKRWIPENVWLREALSEPGVPVIFGEDTFHTDFDIPIDIFGSAFWMLARIEEILPYESDQFDRFSAKQSLAFRGQFIKRPIVDEYVELLKRTLLKKFPGLVIRKSQFRMNLTHDVDHLSEFGLGLMMPWVQGLRKAKRRGLTLGKATTAIRRLVKTPQKVESGDLFNTFDYLMSTSEKHNVASSFYFFGGRTNARRDADYDVSHPASLALMQSIAARGHEIGLHPSFETYHNPELLVTQAERLKTVASGLGITQATWGGRMHFLRWKWPETARAWERAGLNYDSTLGFPDHAGFRCGTSKQYQAFDPVNRRKINLDIIPLIAMECSVIAERYMGLKYTEEALSTFVNLKEKSKKYGGIFTLLWHNSHFTQEADFGLYESILRA